MPTYSYACTECGNSFDIVQSFSDDSLTVCSECGGRLRKLFNSVGIVFKGSGFYRTDSRAGSVPSGSSSESGNGGSDGASSSKPDAASGSKPESGSSSGGTSEKKSSTPAAS